jgi:hypothetical protein
MIRALAAAVALLLGVLAIASPIAAQDSTPPASPGAQQPVTVGETEVTWTGDWKYDEASSMEGQQATLTQVDMSAGSIKLATYGEFEDEAIDSPEVAMEDFSGAFFESAGADSVVEVGAGELENGALWKLVSFNLQSIELAFVVTVSETADGEYVVSTLTATVPDMQQAIEQAQAEIMLNGEPIFLDGIDAAEITSALDAGATPEATPSS